MKLELNSGRLAAFVVAAVLVSVLVVSKSESSLLSTIKRPFKNVYNKARTIINRASPGSKSPWSQINGRSAVPPSSPKSGDGPDVSQSRGSTSADFKSQCFMARGPSFNKPPKLFFYATKTHTPDTLGCDTDRAQQFELKPIEPIHKLSETPVLDRDAIGSKLIDSNLFDPTVPTYFAIHGFMASWNSDNWMCNIKDLVLNSTNANVFIVDWSGGAKPMLPIDYSASVSNTQYVGALLGEFIKTLIDMTGQEDASKYHMIGHSLGAHICGFAGYYVKTLGRITGLDPAGPCFTSDSDKQSQEVAENGGQLEHGKRRLSPESADFVVALHTDTTLFGLDENCAHYDVYVNGGSKQPKCGSTDLGSRFEDLMSLNLGDTFDFNIACAHSYAHQLVETFVEFVRDHDEHLISSTEMIDERVSTSKELVVHGKQGEQTGQDVLNQCFLMGYACSDWEAFKAGECGFCRDSDPRCVFTGLSSSQYQAKKGLEPVLEWIPANGDESIDTSGDDDHFNDEDDEDDVHEEEHEGEQSDEDRKRLKAMQGQHFMRSGNGQQSCLFQYQMIVAAKKSSIMAIKKAGKYYYYLQLPLELSGKLTDENGERLHDRLVQVSHHIDPESKAHERLRSDYIDSLREQNIEVSYDMRDNLEFYAAMVSFVQAPGDACKPDDETNGATRKGRWQICKPLRDIQQTRLWSSSKEKLDAVVWVAMNYMSGVSYKMRLAKSYVLNRDPTDDVQSRDELDKSLRPELSDLEAPKSRSFVSSVGQKATCLLSVFDTGDERHAKRNFKCNRSSKELKFAIKLQPIKMGTLE